ncbi:LuxR C-terminal-related transcriptional regulator [Winogradskyella luteola]|uniref:HTH luxR-type domain-containing protein n=1 Tax=Winogradskyella luteola TaxID=2828330 RepID=A0A9X1JS95_9FLAO|nr:LuxR C-terminal-related transcriptional regulator [Winogradskyella luteola]MBV7269407.1 hypothetical protein [Winogradskyella luteola]
MKIILPIFMLFVGLMSHGQELPPIETFTTSDYGAENQNWMISQDSRNFIYVANNSGLLEFNGYEWKTYPSPNNTILRAVKIIDDVIYTGAYEEFGYWEHNEFGQLNYRSLIPKLDDEVLYDDQIWNIIEYDNRVVFQSGHRLFFYDNSTESFRSITSENIIYKVFNINNKLYYHVANEGIYILEQGKPKLLIDDDIILEDRVINMFSNKGSVVLLTRHSGLFQFKENKLQQWDVPSNPRLRSLNIFSSIQLKDGSLAIGTISNGLIKITENGEIEYEINQTKGLANNTVLSLFEDRDKNVWLGLDNGINCVNVNSPIKTFIDYNGVIGTVYTTLIFNNILYVGTNQGLFYRPLKADEDFKFINGTAGQVWSLFSDNDRTLFCGHHLGTFLIQGGVAKKISPILGAWNFRTVPNHNNLLLQGNYDGLYILEKNKDVWRVRNKIEAFKNSSRFFEINDLNQILVNHEYKGVYKIQLDSTLRHVTDAKRQSELELGKNSSLITYKDNIWYASGDGVFKYLKSKEEFVKDSILTKMVLSHKAVKVVVDQTDKLWLFSQDNISFIENDNLTNLPELHNVAIPSNLRKGVQGFENIQHINKRRYILGTSNGYLTINLSEVENKSSAYTIYLNAVKLKDLNNDTRFLHLGEMGDFKYKYGTIIFSSSVPEYSRFTDVNYQYKLNGQTDRWSTWQKSPTMQFENLPYGDYSIDIRAKIENQLSDNVVNYQFTINRPWYISNLAILLYLLLLLGIGFLIHRAYKFYYERILRHEQIKNERQIIQVKNDKLSQDIDSKNRELATSTMSIVKKNELLRKIKKELKTSTDKKGVKSAIDLIDANLKNNKDWRFFKQAFNNVDKDFLDKIKTEHPDLTPNDLKFCAYLRLNLSSKEIAPLLNISTKSVETKRYRLRKRLNLSHDESLVNYILKF